MKLCERLRATLPSRPENPWTHVEISIDDKVSHAEYQRLCRFVVESLTQRKKHVKKLLCFVELGT